jgi:hypothetical protein
MTDVIEEHTNNMAACQTVDICLFRDKTNGQDKQTQAPPTHFVASHNSYKVHKMTEMPLVTS